MKSISFIDFMIICSLMLSMTFNWAPIFGMPKNRLSFYIHTKNEEKNIANIVSLLILHIGSWLDWRLITSIYELETQPFFSAILLWLPQTSYKFYEPNRRPFFPNRGLLSFFPFNFYTPIMCECEFRLTCVMCYSFFIFLFHSANIYWQRSEHHFMCS